MIARVDCVSFVAVMTACLLVGPVVAAPQDKPGLDARGRGLVLLGELGCTSCHAADKRAPWIRHSVAPRLEAVGSRVMPGYLRSFLADPHATKPGTTMPDVLAQLPADERASAAAALSQFLSSIGGPDRPAASAVASTVASTAASGLDRGAVPLGRELFQTIGCVACHAPRDARGREQVLAGSIPLGRLEKKYSHASLTAFLDDPLAVRPAGRMPDFDLSPRELHALGHFLLQNASGDVPAPEKIDRNEVARGKKLFSRLSCVRCHQLPGLPTTPRPPALKELNPRRGCLSGERGAWPRYSFANGQREAIRAALTSLDVVPTERERIAMHLVAFNCVACHKRDELGGVSKARNDLFTTRDENLGECGRLPPPLTGVGAKLQRDWLVETLAFGQSIRPYLVTRMPGFGKRNTAELVDLLKRVDRRPGHAIAALPKNRKKARVVRDLGHKLVGAAGMNCIACHSFRGRRSAAMAAVDLVETTGRRLEKEWFHSYMLDPIAIRPDVVMPRFFPDGKSIRTDLVGGDATRQIEALWHYLAEGRNARRPRGLVNPPMKIVVADEAVILRRKAQGTGKRAISVGYPGGVSVTFDAESLGLDQIWWGEFVDASPVWTGQGSGAVRISSRQRATLPKGPAFVELANADSPWPTASRRELGQVFLGYDLDAKRRPTFRYRCSDVNITDTLVNVVVAGDGPSLLRRRFVFSSKSDRVLQFRAALDARVEKLDARRVRVGKWLLLRLPRDSFRIREATLQPKKPPPWQKPPVKKPSVKKAVAQPALIKVREMLVRVPIVDGHAELVIDYLRLEAGK